MSDMTNFAQKNIDDPFVVANEVFRKGLSLTTLAQETGYDMPTIQQYFRDAGIEAFEDPPPQNEYQTQAAHFQPITPEAAWKMITLPESAYGVGDDPVSQAVGAINLYSGLGGGHEKTQQQLAAAQELIKKYVAPDKQQQVMEAATAYKLWNNEQETAGRKASQALTTKAALSFATAGAFGGVEPPGGTTGIDQWGGIDSPWNEIGNSIVPPGTIPPPPSTGGTPPTLEYPPVNVPETGTPLPTTTPVVPPPITTPPTGTPPVVPPPTVPEVLPPGTGTPPTTFTPPTGDVSQWWEGMPSGTKEAMFKDSSFLTWLSTATGIATADLVKYGPAAVGALIGLTAGNKPAASEATTSTTPYGPAQAYADPLLAEAMKNYLAAKGGPNLVDYEPTLTDKYMNDAIAAAISPSTDALTQKVLPGITGGTIANGQMGSSRQAIQNNMAIQNWARLSQQTGATMKQNFAPLQAADIQASVASKNANATTKWAAPQTALTNAGNIWSSVAGGGRTSTTTQQLPSTPLLQTVLGGAVLGDKFSKLFA